MRFRSTPSENSRLFDLKHALLKIGGASALVASGAAHSALLERVLDNNGVINAFYYNELDIIRLRDADVNGAQDWAEAAAWAAGLSFGGSSEWWLPTADTACQGQFDCTVGEISHLWYVGLGNTPTAGLTNTGDFQNVQSSWYWSTTQAVEGVAYAVDFRDGRQARQFTSANSNRMYAFAVTNGDVGLVPEPGTYALVLVGSAGVVAVVRKWCPA